MHFVGPDKLHGFDRQLTRDARGAGTITGREWSHSNEDHPAGGEAARRRILEAGPGRSPHLDFDDDVEAAALDFLREPARSGSPWCLVASFLCPHFPLIVPEPYLLRTTPTTSICGIPPATSESAPVPHRVVPPSPPGLPPDSSRRPRRLLRLGQLPRRQTAADPDPKGHRPFENTVIVYTSTTATSSASRPVVEERLLRAASRVPIIFSWRALSSPTRFAGAMSNVTSRALL